jgi:hypothetical protein
MYFVDIVNILRDMRPGSSPTSLSWAAVSNSRRYPEAGREAGIAEVILISTTPEVSCPVKEQMERFMRAAARDFAG